jgi:hypothetical protein
MNAKSIVLISVVGLAGCAGSADHAIVSSYTATDSTLTCSQLHSEMIKTQVVIDGVNRDKDDISGADIMDGIFWFPFNLMAKSDNYEKSLTAAGNRINRLEDLRREKSCTAIDVAETKKAASDITDQLIKLSQLHKDGALSDEEYKAAKEKLLK